MAVSIPLARTSSLLSLLLILLGGVSLSFSQETHSESGVLSIYFNEEKVGYEEFVWEEDDLGYTLTVQGRMDRPVPILIRKLTLRLDKNFIPQKFTMQGSIGGMDQEIVSDISDGRAENTIRVAGQEQQKIVQIKRDALLLPNPIFSVYMVLTKKYRCRLEGEEELSAYIVPQMEIPFTLLPDEENPCAYLLKMGQTEVLLQTEGGGTLVSLAIPSQQIKVKRQ
jgi:hypothetical protein